MEAESFGFDTGPCFFFRAYLLQNFNEEGSTEKPSQEKLHGFAAVLAIGSSRCKANTLGKWMCLKQQDDQ